MTMSKPGDMLRRPFTTDRQESFNKVSKTEVWDPQREREYQREIDNTQQEEGGNPDPPSSDNSKP